MALANYSDLSAAISMWLNRSDLEATYPTFIALFETRANRALRVPQMEVQSTATATSNALALPSDFISAREVRLSEKHLVALSPHEMRDTNVHYTSGNPVGYSIVDQALIFAPPISDTETVYLTYYASIPALTSTETTNWLMTAFPDAYLYGVLAVVYDYLRDGDQAASMLDLSDRIFGEIMADAIRRRVPAGPLIARNHIYNG